MSGDGKAGTDKLPDPFSNSRQDEQLIERCRAGDQEAWATLIDKYKNLIYSIPVKYGFGQQDASEIFQSVCVSLLSEIPSLRESRALAAWLITTTSRRCFRFRKEQNRTILVEFTEIELPAQEAEIPEQLLEHLAQEQLVRDALNDLSPACRQLIDMLFYHDPPVPYEQAATLLNMAKGSLGATRMRCLDKLRNRLRERGFK